MKLVCVCAALLASGSAALAQSAPPLRGAVADAENRWDGLTLGGQVGLAAGSNQWGNPTGLVAEPAYSPRFPAQGAPLGLSAGLTLGYGWQIRRFFLGAEAEIASSGLTSNAPCGGVPGVGGLAWNCATRGGTQGALSLRAGLVEGDALFYGKAGVAYQRQTALIGTWVYNSPPSLAAATLNSIGFVLGAGVEVALNSRWSARLEYDYTDWGVRRFSAYDNTFAGASGASLAQSQNQIKLGVAYRIGGTDTPAPGLRMARFDDFTAEIGLRSGFTGGDLRKTRNDPYVAGQMDSALNWSGQNGAPVEGVVRVDHVSGAYAKVVAGGANLGGGAMTDNEVAPATSPASRLTAVSQSGRMIYGVADLGYDLLRGSDYRAGAFVGYAHLQQQSSASGCNQSLAAADCTGAGAVGPDQIAFGQDQRWNAVRLGLGGDVNLNRRINLALEGAWLPYAHLSGAEYQWLHPNQNPLSESGVSHSSFQLESLASYKITEQTSLGLGARYWSFLAPNAATLIPNALAPSLEKLASNRLTLFVQLATKLGHFDPTQAPVLTTKY